MDRAGDESVRDIAVSMFRGVSLLTLAQQEIVLRLILQSVSVLRVPNNDDDRDALYPTIAREKQQQQPGATATSAADATTAAAGGGASGAMQRGQQQSPPTPDAAVVLDFLLDVLLYTPPMSAGSVSATAVPNFNCSGLSVGRLERFLGKGRKDFSKPEWRGEGLGKRKTAVLKLLCSGLFSHADRLLHLCAAACDSHHAVAGRAADELKHLPQLDLHSPALACALTGLFLGHTAKPLRSTAPPAVQAAASMQALSRSPPSNAVRLWLLRYLARAHAVASPEALPGVCLAVLEAVGMGGVDAGFVDPAALGASACGGGAVKVSEVVEGWRARTHTSTAAGASGLSGNAKVK